MLRGPTLQSVQGLSFIQLFACKLMLPAAFAAVHDEFFGAVRLEAETKEPILTAVIFDLDNCLAPADEVGADFFRPAFDAIAAANDGSVPADAMRQALSDVWFHAFDRVAEQHGFTQAMFDAGWQAFANLEVVKPMQGYADLDDLAAIRADRFLVTSGFRKLQESKIRALGIAGLFHGIFVDAIDEAPRLGKRGCFRAIIERYALAAQDVIVVGDNPDSEIEAGNSLGLRTVQILRPGVIRSEKAARHIHRLIEVASFL